ncbi:MAG: hypothetical protein CL878_10615 [Dehalococcoidia bacterium]|nr:hypothetical protein [Dehalococcoidia bacterium]
MSQDLPAQRPSAEAAGGETKPSDRPARQQGLQALTLSVRSVLALALALVVAALILFALAEVRGVLVTLLVGIILAEALRPSLRTLEGWGLPRFVALLLVLLALLSVFGLLIALVLPPALVQIEQLISVMPSQLERLQGVLAIAETRTDLLNLALEGARTAGSQLLGRVPGLVGQLISVPLALFSAAFATITVILLAVFWLSATRQLDRTLVARLKPDQRRRVRRISRAVRQRIGGWARGQFLMMLAIGVTSFLVLLVFDVRFPVPLAIWAGLTELIPLLGPVLGAVPAILVALVDSPTKALLVGLVYLLIQQVEGNFLVPKIMERVVGLHSFLVLASVLIGGALLGILGVLLAVPVAAVADALVTELVFEPAGLNAKPPSPDDSPSPSSPIEGERGPGGEAQPSKSPATSDDAPGAESRE